MASCEAMHAWKLFKGSEELLKFDKFQHRALLLNYYFDWQKLRSKRQKGQRQISGVLVFECSIYCFYSFYSLYFIVLSQLRDKIASH